MHLTLATAVFLSAVSAGAFAQSLGDVARKEQERRAKNAQPGVKVRSVDDEQLQAGTGTGTGKGTINTLTAPEPGSMPAAPSGAGGDGSVPRGGGAGGVVDTGGGPSDTDRLNAKIESFRASYRPAKARVEALQREVAELEERVARIGQINDYGHQTGSLRTGAERDTARLPSARAELARAQSGLAGIEERARRQGVSAAQLY